MEMDYGADEGRTGDDIRKERPAWDVFGEGPRGGETIHDVAARAARFLRQLGEAACVDDVAIFSHGHYLRIFAATCLALPPHLGKNLGLGPASISVVARQYDAPSLERWNGRAHLDGLT